MLPMNLLKDNLLKLHHWEGCIAIKAKVEHGASRLASKGKLMAINIIDTSLDAVENQVQS